MITVRNETEAQAVKALELAIEAIADSTPSWLWDASRLADTYNEIDRALGDYEALSRDLAAVKRPKGRQFHETARQYHDRFVEPPKLTDSEAREIMDAGHRAMHRTVKRLER